MSVRPSKGLKESAISSVLWLGYGVSAVIVVIMFMGISSLAIDIASRGTLHAESRLLLEFVDKALVVLITMELFRTVMAYITAKNEVLAVLEASLVAVAREIILISKEAEPSKLVSMGLLLLIVFLTYFFAFKSLRGQERKLSLD